MWISVAAITMYSPATSTVEHLHERDRLEILRRDERDRNVVDVQLVFS